MQTINQLPAEILLKVFSYLKYSQKLTVATTCKKWETLIFNGNLFEDFKIEGKHGFQCLTKYFEHNKLHRSQVHRLGITSKSYSTIEPTDILPIPEQFPNLVELAWDHTESEFKANEIDECEKIVNEQNAYHWKHITKFTEINQSSLSIAILKNGGFCNLVELDVDFLWSRDPVLLLRPNCKLFIQHLSNAPQLKRLTLHHGAITLLDLNELHSHTKQLEVLCFNYMVVKDFASEQNLFVSSTASGLIEFRISGCSEETNKTVLTYIAGKYPNLKALKIHSPKNELHHVEDLLVKIVSDSPHLETYDVNIHPITQNIIQAMDASSAKLKAIQIKLERDEDALMQIKNLTASNQKNFVETMKIVFHRLDYEDAIGIAEYFNYLEELPKLKHLELKGVRDCFYHLPKFPITGLLRKLKNLESLILEDWIISFASVDSLLRLVSGPRDKFETKLKSLILNDVDCKNMKKEEFLSFISKTCPKISQFRITELSNNYDEED
ncbi:hypothetical protein [Parasitella parasitica]|uniref:F-box domain-containing protein n=1 Tax=Parasitella parasitica TaxID=35722 RepID=A0A0B7NHE8_9FUNG|nr:hypothetical protein [Parasitella parasitica]